MGKLQSQSTSNPTSISQYAALEALSADEKFIDKNNMVFLKRRNLIIELINNSVGINCKKPDGAFYIFPSCQELIGKKTNKGNIISNSNDFCRYLLEEVGVAAVPGIAFGMENYFRISYATSESILKEAGLRIIKACSKLS